MRRDLGIFIKLNFFGAWMIFVVIIFVLGYGFYAFSNTKYDFCFGKPPHMTFAHDEPRVISLFNWSFAPLMGMLGGGYYLHNISIPIARSAAN
jgi:ABC-type multidrug transport system permease subunit